MVEEQDRQRLIVGMYYYEQLPVGKIAEDLGVTPGTVKTQLYRSRKKIEAAVKRSAALNAELPEYAELDRQIRQEGKPSEGKEFGLTAALDAVREKYGMYAFRPDGKSYDIGLPDAYRETMWAYCQ